jgi:hypothetical protein
VRLHAVRVVREVASMTSVAPRSSYPIHEALRQLVAKLEQIHEHPRFKAVWECAHFRLGAYDGPTYTEELAAANAALRSHPAPGAEVVAWSSRTPPFDPDDKSHLATVVSRNQGDGFCHPLYAHPSPSAGEDMVPRSEMLEALRGQRIQLSDAHDATLAELKRVREVAKTEIERLEKIATPDAQSGVGLHPATAALVREFSDALASKLRAAEIKYGHTTGWLDDDWEGECQSDMIAHVMKGDPLDVAAFAAFCWKRGWSTRPHNPDHEEAFLPIFERWADAMLIGDPDREILRADVRAAQSGVEGERAHYPAEASAWAPLKKALWNIVTGENLNNGHYINSYDLTSKLNMAALAALPAPQDGVRPGADAQCTRPRDFLAWAVEMFGPVAKVRGERLMRFVEEAVELAHADNMELETFHAIIRRVYSRAPGLIEKEIGQAQACLETYAENCGYSSSELAEKEWQRVQGIQREEWTRRHAAKQAIGIALPSTTRGPAA